MNYKININKLSTKNIILLTLIISIASFMAYLYISGEVQYVNDKNKFISLEDQTKGLYLELKSIDQSENWSFLATCDVTGITQDYTCSTSIRFQKNIHSVQELNIIQSKYNPIIENSNIWENPSGYSFQKTEGFGSDFVVSLSTKQYLHAKSNIKCDYTTYLTQSIQDTSPSDGAESMGSPINNSGGDLSIRLTCTKESLDYWYELSNPNQKPKPDSPDRKS